MPADKREGAEENDRDVHEAVEEPRDTSESTHVFIADLLCEKEALVALLKALFFDLLVGERLGYAYAEKTVLDVGVDLAKF